MNVPGVREPTGGSPTELAAPLPARGGMNTATAFAGHASAKAVSADGRWSLPWPTTRGRSDLVGACYRSASSGTQLSFLPTWLRAWQVQGRREAAAFCYDYVLAKLILLGDCLVN